MGAFLNLYMFVFLVLVLSLVKIGETVSYTSNLRFRLLNHIAKHSQCAKYDLLVA